MRMRICSKFSVLLFCAQVEFMRLYNDLRVACGCLPSDQEPSDEKNAIRPGTSLPHVL